MAADSHWVMAQSKPLTEPISIPTTKPIFKPISKPTSKPQSTPPQQAARVGKPLTPSDAADEAQLKTPNERDESVAMTTAKPDPIIIKQAADDVARGLQDTSSGLQTNAAYKKLK